MLVNIVKYISIFLLIISAVVGICYLPEDIAVWVSITLAGVVVTTLLIFVGMVWKTGDSK